MVVNEDFYALKDLSNIIEIYAKLNDSNIVLESVEEMRETLDKIEKEFRK